MFSLSLNAQCSSNVRRTRSLSHMSTIKFTLKSAPNADGKHSIVIQLIKDRKNTTISLGKSVKLDDWSFDTQRVKSQNKQHKALNKFITKYQELLDDYVDDLDLRGVEYSVSDMVRIVRSSSSKKLSLSYTDYQQKIIDNNKDTAQSSTNVFFRDSLSSIKKCFGKEDIDFHEITTAFLFKYEAFMKSNGNSDATIGIRMRTLRSVINKAIDSGLIPENYYPFKKYKIKSGRVGNHKEILTADEIEKLKQYKSDFPDIEFAKDIFLFSYFSRGINFIDLIQLKASNMSGQSFTYTRSKTKAVVTFKLNKRSAEILRKYQNPNPRSPFIFDLLRTANPKKNTVDNFKKKKLKEVNRNLKIIMADLEIDKNITYYCARHSFATQLKFNNISIEIIREALGHKDIKSTMSYLQTLPSNQLDKIIEDVIK